MLLKDSTSSPQARPLASSPWTLVLLAALTGAACQDQDKTTKTASLPLGATSIPEPLKIDRTLTWWADVKPLIDSRCATCHDQGGPGRGALTTYEQVLKRKDAIKAAVVQRTMPPYLALNSCNDYDNNWSLDETQRGTIVSWIDQGAPEGESAAAAAATLPRITKTLSRTDHILTMAAPYQPAANSDDLRCFVLDWPGTSDTYITGVAVVPENKALVHHVIAMLVAPEGAAAVAALDAEDPAPGYHCPNDPGFANPHASMLVAWAPGAGTGDYYPGLGIKARPGSKIIMQMHYNTTQVSNLHGDGNDGIDHPDQSSLQIMTADSVIHERRTLPILNPRWVSDPTSMSIPAGEKNAVHSFKIDPTLMTRDHPFVIYQVFAHQHLLGTSSRLRLIRASGQEECLLHIPTWDFNWQMTYDLKKPIMVLPGDQVEITCAWDNSAAGQPAVGGSQQAPGDVAWGEGGSRNEMCLGFLTVSVLP